MKKSIRSNSLLHVSQTHEYVVRIGSYKLVIKSSEILPEEEVLNTANSVLENQKGKSIHHINNVLRHSIPYAFVRLTAVLFDPYNQ